MWEKMKMKLKCLSRVMLLRCSFQTNGLLYLLILDWHLIDIASKVEIKRNCGAAVYCIYECVYGIGTPLFVGKKKKKKYYNKAPPPGIPNATTIHAAPQHLCRCDTCGKTF